MGQTIGKRRHFEIGEEATLTRNVTAEDIFLFTRLFGGEDSLHPAAAPSPPFTHGSRASHAMLLGSMISTLLEKNLPGPGAVFLSQNLQALAPVQPGDQLTATVMVTSWDAQKGRLTLWTEVSNQNGVKLLTGEARLAVTSPFEHRD